MQVFLDARVGIRYVRGPQNVLRVRKWPVARVSFPTRSLPPQTPRRVGRASRNRVRLTRWQDSLVPQAAQVQAPLGRRLTTSVELRLETSPLPGTIEDGKRRDRTARAPA